MSFKKLHYETISEHIIASEWYNKMDISFFVCFFFYFVLKYLDNICATSIIITLQEKKIKLLVFLYLCNIMQTLTTKAKRRLTLQNIKHLKTWLGNECETEYNS